MRHAFLFEIIKELLFDERKKKLRFAVVATIFSQGILTRYSRIFFFYY